MKRRWMSVVLIISLLWPLLGGAQPVNATPSLPPVESHNRIEPEEVQKAIELLEPYVSRSQDGTFTLFVEKPEKLGVRPEVYEGLLAGMEIINDLVRQEKLRTDEHLNVYIAGEESNRLISNRLSSCEITGESIPGSTLASCPGNNYVQFHWWGVSVGLDHCVTNNLIYLLGIGAGASAIAALLAAHLPIDGPFGEILFGLAAAILGINAATYSWADNMYGCGSVTHYPWYGPSWVSPQHC